MCGIAGFFEERILVRRSMRKAVSLLLLLLLTLNIYSQEKSGDIETYLTDIVQNLPGSNGNDFTAPTQSELTTWGNSLNSLLEGDLVSARTSANSINYDIIDYTDNTLTANNEFYIIQEKTTQSKYWGTYIISKNPLRKELIIQTPHPSYDSNTGYQGIYCFKRLIPGALFISGTHRCNNSEFSVCSGTSSACGDGTTSYRISDNAHNVNSVFQKSTEIFFNEYEGSVFIQLHGFAKGDTDPYLIMSNGTRVTPENDYVSQIKDALWLADPGLTFKAAHLDFDWSRLIAFSNTQGRLINESANPCTQNATNSEGRFVHIEQERVRLRSSSSAWHKMYLALSNVFQAETGTYEIANNSAKYQISVYPNPTNGLFSLNSIDPLTISIYNLNGVLLLNEQSIEGGSLIDISDYASGFYILKIQHNNEVLIKKIGKL